MSAFHSTARIDPATQSRNCNSQSLVAILAIEHLSQSRITAFDHHPHSGRRPAWPGEVASAPLLTGKSHHVFLWRRQRVVAVYGARLYEQEILRRNKTNNLAIGDRVLTDPAHRAVVAWLVGQRLADAVDDIVSLGLGEREQLGFELRQKTTLPLETARVRLRTWLAGHKGGQSCRGRSASA